MRYFIALLFIVITTVSSAQMNTWKPSNGALIYYTYGSLTNATGSDYYVSTALVKITLYKSLAINVTITDLGTAEDVLISSYAYILFDVKDTMVFVNLNDGYISASVTKANFNKKYISNRSKLFNAAVVNLIDKSGITEVIAGTFTRKCMFKVASDGLFIKAISMASPFPTVNFPITDQMIKNFKPDAYGTN